MELIFSYDQMEYIQLIVNMLSGLLLIGLAIGIGKIFLSAIAVLWQTYNLKPRTYRRRL